jgi:hypothetical protein
VACLHLDFSRISELHNGVLVMRLKPTEGEKQPVGLSDRVGYRVCRVCGYGFIWDIELHTSGGHGMGREIIHRIIGPHRDLQWGTSLWKLSSVGFWEKMSAARSIAPSAATSARDGYHLIRTSFEKLSSSPVLLTNASPFLNRLS